MRKNSLHTFKRSALKQKLPLWFTLPLSHTHTHEHRLPQMGDQGEKFNYGEINTEMKAKPKIKAIKKKNNKRNQKPNEALTNCKNKY